MDEDAPTQGISELRAAKALLGHATRRLERELVGFEHLAGALLAYAQGLQGYDPRALNDLAQHWLRSGEFALDDPALEPFERLEAVLRSQLGEPVLAAELPKEQQRGFPYPPLLRRVK
ncbi:hypothetical protein [Vandammella animalimorsus]|nr:hypothetical protein [Vandammella animalimorsus]